MADFLTGKELNNTLGHLFEAAKSQIIIISPYIKLHSGYRELLEPHQKNPQIALTVVFGKNEDDLSKSLRKDDFSFFREFANVEIRYEPTLHAKYYANESYAILTSIWTPILFDYSTASGFSLAGMDYLLAASLAALMTLFGVRSIIVVLISTAAFFILRGMVVV